MDDIVPKKKPYTEESFKKDADLYIKGYLGGFPKPEMKAKLENSIKKIQESGIMSSAEAMDFVIERASTLKEFIRNNPGETLPQMKAYGGRINFELGGDTKYQSMVTRMYILSGGQEATGLTIEQFANQYFPRDNRAYGGRIGFKGGADASSADFGNENFGGGGGDNNREQYRAQTQYQAPPPAPSGDGNYKASLMETIKKTITPSYGMMNPYNYDLRFGKNFGPLNIDAMVSPLSVLNIDDPRTPIDESEADDYRIGAGINTPALGGILSLGTAYSPSSNLSGSLRFSKQFSQGGRASFKDGTMTKSEKWMRDYFFSGKGGYDDRMSYKEFALGPGQELYKKFGNN